MRFPYAGGPEGEAFEIPDDRLVAVLEPRKGEEKDLDTLIVEALGGPVYTPPLRDMARGKENVLLIVDDSTRATPVARILPHVARELETAGVADHQITVLVANGTHRALTVDELDEKIGTEFLRRWDVRQHDHTDEDGLISLGSTKGGMPVAVNGLVHDADFVLGIGHVGVHGIMGYSGGAKIVVPGTSSDDSEAWTHWNALQEPEARLMGVFESKYRQAVEDAAELAGLDAVLNIVVDTEGRVQHAAFGHFVRAQRECARVARELSAAHLDERVDVVVTDAHPADRDYWQSVKGLYAADLCVKDDGAVILVAPNPEGVADNHPNVLELAGRPSEEIRARVEEGREEDVVGAAVAYSTARLRERAHVILVSSGIDPSDANLMGFVPAASIREALDIAFERVSGNPRVAVLKHAGALLPVVKGVNDFVLTNEQNPVREVHEASARGGGGEE